MSDDADSADTDPGDTDPTNDGQRFDRVPETPADREVDGRASRREVINWWHERFGIDPSVFEEYSFWEKGAGKIWIYAGEAPTPLEVEAIGMTCLRTRQEHWKPTTDFVQRFGRHATDCVIDLDGEEARAFAAGEDREIPRWGGDWGYLIAAHDLAGEREPLGVGLYVHGELRSMVPKGRQREL